MVCSKCGRSEDKCKCNSTDGSSLPQLTGPKPGEGLPKVLEGYQPVVIQQMSVSPRPMPKVQLGDTRSLVDIATLNKDNLRAIIWNEDEIGLMLHMTDSEIYYNPRMERCVSMFFERKSNRDEDSWKGDYDSVSFTKKNLLEFLKFYAEHFDDEVHKALKKLKVQQRKTYEDEEITLDEDTDRSVQVDEVKNITNLPKKFSATFPVFENYKIDLEFEAVVTKKDDTYSRSKRSYIEVTCINAREAKRRLMEEIVNKLPEGVPRYYGELRVEKGWR